MSGRGLECYEVVLSSLPPGYWLAGSDRHLVSRGVDTAEGSAFVLSFAFYFFRDPTDITRSTRTLELTNRQGGVVSYIEDSLSAGERIESLFKLHWFAWVPVWLWAILAIPTIGLTLFVALYVYLQLRFTEQGVTNKRVILKKGVISRKTEEMKLTSIETVEIQQGIWGRLFGFGSVKVTGRGISNLVYKGIDDPMAVKRQIESVSNPSP